MNTREEKGVILIAMISALAEGVRMFGSQGVGEEDLFTSMEKMMSRSAFDLLISELVVQKTLKKHEGLLIYCGPCAL